MLKFRIDQHMPDINYAQSDTIEEENKIGKHLAETQSLEQKQANKAFLELPQKQLKKYYHWILEGWS